jgi:hypothetical protein
LAAGGSSATVFFAEERRRNNQTIPPIATAAARMAKAIQPHCVELSDASVPAAAITAAVVVEPVVVLVGGGCTTATVCVCTTVSVVDAAVCVDGASVGAVGTVRLVVERVGVVRVTEAPVAIA